MLEATFINHNADGSSKATYFKSYTYYFDSFLKLVFGFYMLYAIYRVKTTINQHEILNTKNLTLHVVSDVIYMMISVIKVVAFGFYANGMISSDSYYIALTFSLTISAFNQMSMSYIFRNLEAKKKALKKLAERVRPASVDNADDIY